MTAIAAAVVLTSYPTLSIGAPLAAHAKGAGVTIFAGAVARAQFTTAVKDREPTDSLSSVGADKTEIFFFTELTGLNGTKVTHRWEHDGKPVREQSFDVGGDRWRVWSSKGLSADLKGEWKVTVVDGSGATLGTYTLTYGTTEP